MSLIDRAATALRQIDEERARCVASTSILARQQPCGCIVCICEDDKQRQGCGASNCGSHPPGQIPNPVYEVATARTGYPAALETIESQIKRHLIQLETLFDEREYLIAQDNLESMLTIWERSRA